MKLAVLFCGDGRFQYLQVAVQAARERVSCPVTAWLMVNDEADPGYCSFLDEHYPEFDIAHTGRVGMAGAVQAGFDLVVKSGADYVLWIEEDMLVTREVPVLAAATILKRYPQLAQVTFEREVWEGSSVEVDLGSQRKAIAAVAPQPPSQTRDVMVHSFIFSLNPCLIPAHICEFPYPAGPLGVGNEAGMTNLLLDKGYRFAMFGVEDDTPYARHIGYERSRSWQL